MSEQIHLEPPVNQDVAHEWLQEQVFDNPHTGPVTYDRGRGPEEFILKDASWVHMNPSDYPHGTDDYLAMELIDSEGNTLTVDPRDYLKQNNYDEAAHLAKREERWRLAAEKACLGQIEKEKAYYYKLFAPIEEPPLGQKEDLLPGNKRQLSRTEYGNHVNDVTRRDSAELLEETLLKDPKLQQVLANFAQEIDLTSPLAMVDAIRTHKDVRFAVGIYYRVKLDGLLAKMPDKFGERVVDDERKQTRGITAKYYVNSRDYVAVLCLDKLGGSFNRRRLNGEIDDRSALPGQHTPAADLVIAS